MGKLVKYIASVLCALVVVCSFSSVAFADSLLDPTYNTALKNFNYVWNDAYENGVVCPKCGHIISKLMMGTCYNCGFNALVDDGTVNNYRPGFETGGGSTSGGGIGRKDLPGFLNQDNGTPSITPEGYTVYELKPYFWIETNDTRNAGFYPEFPYFSYSKEAMRQTAVAISGNTFYCDEKFSTSSIGVAYGMVAPVTGVYKIYKHPSVRSYSFTTSSGKNVTGNLELSAIGYFPSSTSENSAVTAGNNVMWHYGKYKPGDTSSMFEMTATSLYVQAISRTTNLTVQNNITINNSTWNGNIYVDNSNNLTYIYPQYTENNETVISTNPIIYNNTTNRYYTYVNNNYYYIADKDTSPSPSPAPAPTWTPGGGATRGGGVGRHPSDTDAADWTLHYYVLNNRRYDAYYALKKTEVDTDTKLPWVDNKKYISTTQIPIANGQYTVSVPDGVYWRVWSWDEASQTLTGVNSSNWHSTINNFLFNATGEYIFEFCKADGSDFDTAKDVTLKLKNDKITDYEDGGTIVEEPTPSPSPEPTETPSPTEPPTPTATPNPGGGTVPTPGGDSGGGNSGSNDSGWNPFKWLTDLLKDIVETILKGLWKLLTSIFGFILWLLSLLFKLFPWMPNSGILALCAGVVVVTVIRIIKFITGR